MKVIVTTLLVLLSQGAFGAPLTLSEQEAEALAPEIAIGPNGSVNTLWIQKRPLPPVSEDEHRHAAADDLYFSRSLDGIEFSPPVRVNQEPGEVWGFAVSNPQIVVDDAGIIHVLYPANAVSAESERMMVVNRYTRSTDGGKTFSEPRTLNANINVSGGTFLHGGIGQAHAFAAIAATPGGRVLSYWIDTRHMKSDKQAGALYGAISEDRGATFGPDFMVWEDGACPCCQITLATPTDETIFMGLRKVTGPNRNSSVACSEDGGRSFDDPVSVVKTDWEIAGCPLKPTAVAVDGDQIFTAWYSAAEPTKGAYFSRSEDGGQSYSEPLLLHPDALLSDAPVIVRLDGAIVVAWHSKVDGGRRVFWRHSVDDGITFGPVQEAVAPIGKSSNPALAVGDRGQLHLVFEHDRRIVYDQLSVDTKVAAK